MRFQPILALSVPEAYSHPPSRLWHPPFTDVATGWPPLLLPRPSTAPLLCMILFFLLRYDRLRGSAVGSDSSPSRSDSYGHSAIRSIVSVVL